MTDMTEKNAANLEVMTKLANLLRDFLQDKGCEVELPQERFNQGELTHLRYCVPVGEGRECPIHIYRPNKI
jgi:hypothetical protein